MKARRLLASLILTIAVGGCAQAGSTVIRHDNATAARTISIEKAGAYALYDTYDTTPQVTVQLLAGDKLGFSDDSGNLIAIGGARTFPITGDRRSYYWKMK